MPRTVNVINGFRCRQCGDSFRRPEDANDCCQRTSIDHYVDAETLLGGAGDE